MDSMRRVVTGHDAEGRSVFVSDAKVEPVTFSMAPDGGFHLLWSADEPAVFPSDGIDPYDKGLARHFFPVEPGSFRFNIFTVPPQMSGADVADIDPAAIEAEVEAKLPGILSANDPDRPGIHTTDTIDLEIMLAGELTLELDDGVEKVLRKGDVIIQNGTNHRWHNRGTETAVLAAVLIAGRRES
jgi:hypothetical protein